MAANRNTFMKTYILLQEATKDAVTLGRAKFKSKAFILDQLKDTKGTQSLPILFSNKAFRRVTLNTHYPNLSDLLKGSYLKPTLSIIGLGAKRHQI